MNKKNKSQWTISGILRGKFIIAKSKIDRNFHCNSKLQQKQPKCLVDSESRVVCPRLNMELVLIRVRFFTCVYVPHVTITDVIVPGIFSGSWMFEISPGLHIWLRLSCCVHDSSGMRTKPESASQDQNGYQGHGQFPLNGSSRELFYFKGFLLIQYSE